MKKIKSIFKIKYNYWCCFGYSIVICIGKLAIDIVNPIKVLKVFINKEKKWTKNAWIGSFTEMFTWGKINYYLEKK